MRDTRPLPSLLPRWLRFLLGIVLALAAVVLADTLYLLGVRFAEAVGLRPGGGGAAVSPVFQVALLAHSILGVLLVGFTLLFVGFHLPRVWRRRRSTAIGTGAGTLGACLLLLLTGLFIFTEAATREHRWVWWLHVVGAAGLPALYAAHRRASVVRISGWHRRFGLGLVGLTLGIGVGHAVVAIAGQDPAEGGVLGTTAEQVAIARYGVVPPGFASPASPFYPSPATTVTGTPLESSVLLGPRPVDPARVAAEVAANGYYAGPGIGAESCRRCHPDVTAQWESSAHRFSSFNNPFYTAAVDLLRSGDARTNPWLEIHRETTGSEATDGLLKSQWCGACHDPALLFTGGMSGSIDPSSLEAQAGLTCLTCHGVRRIPDRTGNGNFALRATEADSYLFSGATEPGWKRTIHDAALRARPDAHRAAMLPTIATQPELCGTCHKVSLREPVNGYRWIRGQNEFDVWENSGVSGEGAQTFYLPPERRVCRDCHMPRVDASRSELAAEQGTVLSHRFAAANTALPYVRGDTAMLQRVEEFLRDEIVTLDVFGYREGPEPQVLGLRGPIRSRPGTELEVDVVVRNRGVGHAFPGGTLDSNEGWLDVRLLDQAGNVVARNGGLGADGRLDPAAHVFRALFVDSAGREIDRRNPQDIRAVIFANAIGPGTAALAHYRLRVPDAPGRYTLDVRLRWRKFNRPYSNFVFDAVPAAFPDSEEAPRLPVTTITEAVVEVHAGIDPEAADVRADTLASASWGRWNDFGIASIREGRTRSALRAFGEVARLAPERADGPMNLARVALAEGDVAGALDHLEEARRRGPDDERIDWLLGEVLLADGSYERAVAAYGRALEAFPRHRASLLGLARALYLDGRFEEALGPLDVLLAIDPESRPAWYHRMLVLRSAGRAEAARSAEAMVEYLRVDETAGRLTRDLRAADPGVNAMVQDVRIHRLTAPGS